MKGHNHKCQTCGEKFHCTGELLRNYDGWPEVICDLYHVHGKDFRLCERCALGEQPEQARTA